jgi:uncharacterized protein
VIIEKNVEMRARDGVILRADVWKPQDDGRYPAILVRTPYGKDNGRKDSLLVAAIERGYVVVAQDVRGRYASDGQFDPYRQEGRDGYDAVEWAASQPWCTGRVGTAGLSYPGAVQWLLAVEAPPHLACIFPAMCFSSAHPFFYFGGAFDLSWISWTYINITPDARRRAKLPGPQTVRDAAAEWRKISRSAYRHVPLNTLPLLEDVAPFYFEWLDHPDDGSYWEFADIESRHDRVTVPAFNLSGWHDEGYGPVGAIRNFLGMRRRGATPAARSPRLLIGPWKHGDPSPSSTRVGDRDFGPDAGLDYTGLVLDWCNWHLKGIDAGISRRAPVRFFAMGENRWHEATDWPPPGTRARTLYLRGGGRLAWEGPSQGEKPDHYTYDPNTPLEDPHFDAGLGPHDQRAIEQRSDLLVFTTPPLEQDLLVVGEIEIRLWIASSAPDTDFYARLLDVEPDGPVWNLMSPTLEVLRARYRKSLREPELMRPGMPYELVLRSGVTANRFLRGHRIRVHITSSFFPHLDRNPNTGRPVASESRLVPATQVVFHDSARPSRVILRVLGE